jgi:hypothetical protein
MRHIKMACGLAVAVGTLGASVAPALAASASSNFIASIPHRTISPEHTAKTSGKTEESQTFKFNNVKIVCQVFKAGSLQYTKEGPAALTAGVVSEELSTTLEVTIHFQKCGRIIRDVPAEPKEDEYVPANFKGKVTIIYHVNGFGEILGNGEGEELEYGKGKNATIRETAATFKIAPAKQCTVIIPEQTVPIKAIKHPEEEFSAATYSNVFTPTVRRGFVNNEKESLEISNAFKGLTYHFAEETQCGEDEKSNQGTNGSYTGNLNLEIPTGNLGLEEKVES